VIQNWAYALKIWRTYNLIVRFQILNQIKIGQNLATNLVVT